MWPNSPMGRLHCEGGRQTGWELRGEEPSDPSPYPILSGLKHNTQANPTKDHNHIAVECYLSPTALIPYWDVDSPGRLPRGRWSEQHYAWPEATSDDFFVKIFEQNLSNSINCVCLCVLLYHCGLCTPSQIHQQNLDMGPTHTLFLQYQDFEGTSFVNTSLNITRRPPEGNSKEFWTWTSLVSPGLTTFTL